MTVPHPEPVYLEQLPVKLRRAVPEIGTWTAGNMKLTRVSDRMMLELCTAILGARILSDTQRAWIEFPATWWQQLKERHAPPWFRRRWPVQMGQRSVDVDYKRYDTYPLASIPLTPSEFGHPVAVEMSRLRFDQDGVHLDPPGPPRFRYVPRAELAARIFEMARDQFAINTDPNSDGPHPRYAIAIIFDALERLGVNVSELVDQDAFFSPMPEKEASCSSPSSTSPPR